ncbi:MAG: hypothetical protein V4592_20750 [Bacteroidota bacterium]
MKWRYLLALSALLFAFSSNAQKLPAEQKDGVYAPDNIKIDGKDTEWVGNFQAYNRSTQIYYTMANDEDNLYLAIQVGADPRFDNTKKILSRGITLAIKNRSKADKAGPVSLTFPLIDQDKRSNITLMMRNKKLNQDSLLSVINEQFAANSKEIGISGIKQITDTLISVYNTDGIKAASAVDAKRVWTYELQLPLKYISHLMDDRSAFDYKIIVNGGVMPKLAPGEVMVVGASSSGRSAGGAEAIFDMFSPTDLSATYTLAKK